MRVVLKPPTPQDPSHGLVLILDGKALPLIDGHTGRVADLTAELRRGDPLSARKRILAIGANMMAEPDGRARMKG